jgi:glucose/arabinose dehydrogenase
MPEGDQTMRQVLLKITYTFAAVALVGCQQMTAQAERTPKPTPNANVASNPISVDPATYLEQINLPPGFEISIFSDDVEGARSMALTPGGTLFVGTRAKNRKPLGKVYAVTGATGEQVTAGQVYTVARDLNYPNGVAWRDGALYVAEIQQILRFDNIEDRLDNPPEPQVVNDSFPNKYHHGWKYIAFGPDDRLYVPVGAPCNVCESSGEDAILVSIKADGSDRRVEALGIRNSVGFAWHPETDELWLTDNGRDLWDDDTPPEELNQVTARGQHFGFPYRYGRNIVDTEFSTDMKASEFTSPALEFPAHNALLGMDFNTHAQFPNDYSGDLFVASHGSWNRSVPDGYRIYRVRMEDGNAVDYEIFADGWLTEDKQYWGRPVDIKFMADGSMLVSDDHAGVIYRISYSG